jgi:Arc/MetJ-type ribon-helix-helix transcriptional regulator
MPEKLIKEVDRWVAEGRFKSRSDAIKTIVALYEEKEKTREFYKMLNERSREAEERPDTLIPLEDTL